MKRLFILFVVLILSSSGLITAKDYEVKDIQYEYLGAFKGYLCKPKGNGPFPVVVYSYDEFIDWAGEYVANKRGYNLKETAQWFAKRGYAVIIPRERFRKVNAVLGAVQYMKKQRYVNKNKINLVGLSEGGFINLIVLQQSPDINAVVCMAPIIINDKGYLSLFNFDQMKRRKVPIFFLEARDTSWRINSQNKILFMLGYYQPKITHKMYNVKKRWFWYSNQSFMRDIHNFLRKQ